MDTSETEPNQIGLEKYGDFKLLNHHKTNIEDLMFTGSLMISSSTDGTILISSPNSLEEPTKI